jgi:chitin synthase
MLLREIRDILASADLMKVTKRDVRAELERRFGCNLRARKEYIKAAMQAVMDGTL